MSEFEPFIEDLHIPKFGGESMLFMENAGARIDENDRRLLSVVSALGKVSLSAVVELGLPEGIHEEKVTDQLFEYFDTGSDELLDSIVAQHDFEAQRLELFSTDEDREALMVEFRTDIKGAREGGSKDDTVIQGEIMAAKLLAQHIGGEFIDPREVVMFLPKSQDCADQIDLDKTSERRRTKCSKRLMVCLRPTLDRFQERGL